VQVFENKIQKKLYLGNIKYKQLRNKELSDEYLVKVT